MSNYLINTDSNLSGIFRVIIIYKVGEEQSRIFIPGQVVNPLNSDGTLNEAVFEENKLVYPLATWNSKPMRDLIPEDKVLPGWIVYESGDAKRPIIIGYLGKGLDMADEWSIEVVYNYVFLGDGTGVDTGEGYVDQNGDYVTPVEGGGSLYDIANAIYSANPTYIYGSQDCSHLTMEVLKKAGLIPTNAGYMTSTAITAGGLENYNYTKVTGVNLKTGAGLQAGDVISRNGHVSVYLGNGKMTHNTRSKGNYIGDIYWNGSYTVWRKK